MSESIGLDTYRQFRGVLNYSTVEVARESVANLDRLYQQFERERDIDGQLQVMNLALTGRNRAQWSGKPEQSAIFGAWLESH